MAKNVFQEAAATSELEDEETLANFADAMIRRWRKAQKDLFSGDPIDTLSNEQLMLGLLRQVPQAAQAIIDVDDPNHSLLDVAIYSCEMWRRIQQAQAVGDTEAGVDATGDESE